MDLRTMMPKEPDCLSEEIGSEHKGRAMGVVYWTLPQRCHFASLVVRCGWVNGL